VLLVEIVIERRDAFVFGRRIQWRSKRKYSLTLNSNAMNLVLLGFRDEGQIWVTVGALNRGVADKFNSYDVCPSSGMDIFFKG